MIMKNKKGILVKETLGIVLAVVGIVLLVYLAVELYGLFDSKTGLEKAKGSLDTLYSGVGKVDRGEVEESEFFLESPNDWWVIAWPYQDRSDKPTQCKGNCICICPMPSPGLSVYEGSLKKCNNLGVCKDVSKPIKTIYDAEASGLYAKTRRSLVNALGYDTVNVPIDIKGDLPLKVVLVDGEILVKKEGAVEG